MKLLTWQSQIRGFIEQRHIYLILYALFILGFFVCPSIHWHNNFYYAFIIPIYLISLQKEKFQIFFHSKIWLLSMVLALYLSLTLLWAENPGDEGVIYYLRRPLYIFVFLSMTMELVLKYPRFIDYLFLSLPWVGAITAVISIFSFYTSISFPPARLEYLADQLHNPIEGGTVYGMIALITYFNVLKTPNRQRKWLYVGFMIIIIFSVLLTQSRGPIGSLLATFIVGGLITRDKKLLITLGCVIIIGLTLFFNIQQLQKRFISRGLSYRVETGQKTIAKVKGDLIFGKGLSTNSEFIMSDGRKITHTHNVYLGMILYGGLVGLFILLFLLAAVFWKGLDHYFWTNNITYFALILFAAVCITTGEDKIITHPDSIWMFFWLPLGLLAGQTQIREQKKKQRYPTTSSFITVGYAAL